MDNLIVETQKLVTDFGIMRVGFFTPLRAEALRCAGTESTEEFTLRNHRECRESMMGKTFSQRSQFVFSPCSVVIAFIPRRELWSESSSPFETISTASIKNNYPNMKLFDSGRVCVKDPCPSQRHTHDQELFQNRLQKSD